MDGGRISAPLGDRLRLRLGGDLSRQDYGGKQVDQTSESVHAGPRWLVDRDTEVSLRYGEREAAAGPARLPPTTISAHRVEAMHRLTRVDQVKWPGLLVPP